MEETSTTSREAISGFFRSVQDEFCNALETADGQARFKQDDWDRVGGGGGRTRVIEDGAVFEKGGVNYSAVWGEMPPSIKKTLDLCKNSSLSPMQFYATGISVVIHPVSPLVPIIHLNLRYFEVNEEPKPITRNPQATGKLSWFGGGIDLTPHYINVEDAAFFHQELREVCDKFHPDYYSRFKTWADEYFFIKHRQETRGIGGIFFDRLEEPTPAKGQGLPGLTGFDFVKEVANSFIPIYTKLIDNNKHKAYGEQELEWQLLRRGRYVEFNLIYDRGTKFGLETNGRIESILMSLPKKASWLYDFKPAEDSPEQQTLDLLKKGINWAG